MDNIIDLPLNSCIQTAEMEGRSEKDKLLPEGGTNVDNGQVRRTQKYIPIEVSISLYFMSFLICMPVLQFYIYDAVGDKHGISHLSQLKNGGGDCGHDGRNSSQNHSVNIDQIQKEATTQYLYLSLASGLPAILPVLYLGSITDRLGRRFYLIIVFIGSLIRQSLMLVTIHLKLPIGILFIGSAIEGLTGGFAAALMVAFGILADITNPGQQRAMRITIIEGIVAFAGGLTLLGTAFWLNYSGYEVPNLVAAILMLINVFFTFFFIPETAYHRDNTVSVFSPEVLLRVLRIYYKDTPEKRRTKLILCIVSFGLGIFCMFGKTNIWTLFVLHKPFCWQQLHVNLFNAVQISLTWPLGALMIRLFHDALADVGLVIIGALSGVLGYAILTFAYVEWLIYAAAVVYGLTTIVIPMIRSIMSRLVSPQEQGALFAGIASMEMLFNTVGSLVLNLVYGDTVSFFPGFAFLVVTFLMAIVLILLIILKIKSPSSSQLTYSVIVPEDGEQEKTASTGSIQ